MLEEIAGSLVRDLMRVNVFDSCCSGTLLMTDKAIDKPHQLIRERALYRRNLTLRTATARSHNPLKPYSNKLPLNRLANWVSFVRGWHMGAYSKDLRLKVPAAVDRGVPRAEAVQMFGVSLATLKRWLKRRKEGEDLSPRPSTGRKKRILATDEERRVLWAQLEEDDDATLERHCQLWEHKLGAWVSAATMSRAIRRLGWTRKKIIGCHRVGRRDQKRLVGAPEGRRPQAAGVRGRVLDEHRPQPTLRQGTQR